MKEKELKTLKDLKDKADKEAWYRSRVFKETKKEAIKWVQQFNKEGSAEMNNNAIDFIKHFFNITEDELK